MATLNVTGTVRDSGGLTTPYTGTIITTSTSQRGLVQNFNPTPDNWQTPITIDGGPWWIETAGQAWSLTNPDPYRLRMELRAGDFWADDGSSRCEVQTKDAPFVDGITYDVSYSMLVEPGPSTVDHPLAWLLLTQFHEGDTRPFVIGLIDEKMMLIVNFGSTISQMLYFDTNPILRGQSYDIHIQIKFGTNGLLKFWRDGVQLIDYVGAVGTASTGQWLKLGIYRGEAQNANYTMAAQYSHIAIDTGTPPPPPPPPPPGPYKLGESTILTGPDSGNANALLAQSAVLPSTATLQSLSFYVATVSGQVRLGIYDATGLNGGPGAIKGQTAAFTPVVGWNTKTVTNVTLPAGTYWLAHTLQNNSLVYRQGASFGVSYVRAEKTFGSMPASFPAVTETGPAHWSLYATVNIL